MPKLRIAVIGTGAMGKSHVRLYKEIEDIEVVAVVDKDKKTIVDISKKYDVKGLTDYKELDNVDAASICVPTKYHKEVSLYFIKKGVHVLIEKPIATDVSEARELIGAAKKNNVKLMVGHVERFNPVVQEVKKRVLEGKLGKIYDIKALRFSPFPHRVIDVGVTVDLAVHDIDVLMYLTGSDVERVYAETSQRIHNSKEDLLNALLRFKNGVNGVLHTSWLTPRKVREFFVTGEKGMFVGKYLTQELTFYNNQFATEGFDYSKGVKTVIEGKSEEIKIENKEPLKLELEEFISCIKEDREPQVTGEDGLKVLNIAMNMIKAAKEGKVITL